MKTNKTQNTGRRQTKHRMKTNKTQDEDKQNTGRRQTKHKSTTQHIKLKRRVTRTPPKTRR
jgi:hypothetical protein